MVAARKARSITDVWPFLPLAKQADLKRRQKNYDPADVPRRKAWHRKHGSRLTEAELTRLTDSPFESALQWHRSTAKKIVAIERVKIDGDRAVVTVVTSHNPRATTTMERSTATVTMVKEQDFWRVSGYKFAYTIFRSP